MYHAVAELGELAAVPSAGCTNKVTGDALELVDVLSTAVWTLYKTLLCVLVSAVHTAVAVVVY